MTDQVFFWHPDNGVTGGSEYRGDLPASSVVTDKTLSGNGTAISPLSVVGGGSAPAIVQSGLMADYQFTEGSGTTAHDSSGNGYDGTIGATSGAAPTWISPGPGITLGGVGHGRVSLPSALNSAVTISMVVDIQASAHQDTGSPQMYSLFSSNGNGSTGNCAALTFASSYQSAGAFLNAGTPQLFTMGSNTLVTYRAIPNGRFMVTLVMTGTTDKLYINDVQVAVAVNAGSLLNATTIGNYFLGYAATGINPAYNALGFKGSIYRAMFYSRALSPAEVLQNALAANAMMASSSLIPNTPVGIGYPAETQSLVLVSGDSIAIQNPTFPMLQYAGGDTWKIANCGIAGGTQYSVAAGLPYSLNNLYRPHSPNNILVVQGCGNDLGGGSILFGQISMARVAAYARASGWNTCPCTILPRATGGFNILRNAYNLWLSQQFTNFGDSLINLASDPTTGPDSAASDTSLYGDGVHPTNLCNYNYHAPIYQCGINRLLANNSFGMATTYTSGAPSAATLTAAACSGNTVTFTTSAPHGFVVGQLATVSGVTPSGYNRQWWILSTPTGTTFTAWIDTALGAGSVFGVVAIPLQKDVDNFVILGGSSSSQNFTLQPASFRTGTRINIMNTDPNSWTITPYGSETINGSGSITLAQNKVAVLEATANSSGICSTWVQVQ